MPFFGNITPPEPISKYGADIQTGPMKFANNIFKLLIVGAGLYTFLNVILAGYDYLSAGGDPKKVTQAGNKIWQSIIGLVIVAGSLVIATVIGWLIFKDPTAIISPKVYGPND